MRQRFFDLTFTPAVQTQQVRHGSRIAYEAVRGGSNGPAAADWLSDREAAFIAARDSFYLASTSESGWPYVQHRGGPAGFVRILDNGTIGWAEFAGNRQYITAGNTAADDRVSLFFMDYPHRRRLKLLGHAVAHEPDVWPDLADALRPPGYPARVETLVVVAVEAFDWNCSQHITPRFTEAEMAAATAPLHARIAELEARLATGDRPGADGSTSVAGLDNLGGRMS